MIRRAAITLIVCLCALSLSLHFAVESLGALEAPFVGEQAEGMPDAHEADQFVLGEVGKQNPARTWISLPFQLELKILSCPLSPLFQPPKPI